MKNLTSTLLAALLLTACASAPDPTPPQNPSAPSRSSTQSPSAPTTYLWLEPEWFPQVAGSFAYWTGPNLSPPTHTWQIAGPGISPEWTQGGESEWNSMAAPASETQASASRSLQIPHPGKYKLWVRYVDHLKQSEPFFVQIDQPGKPAIKQTLGQSDTLPPNDEYQLWWGFSFAWASIDVTLDSGPATLTLGIDQPAQAWRQLDALLLTDNLSYTPAHREKPPFHYFSSFNLPPSTLPQNLRGSAKNLPIASTWATRPLAGRRFTMWTPLPNDPEFWKSKPAKDLTLFDAIAAGAVEPSIKKEFLKDYARPTAPILNFPNYVPGSYLGYIPQFTPDSPLYQWLTASRSPFYMLTNYANPAYTDTTGPAVYKALSGPLADQFLGFIHGESISSMGVSIPSGKLGPTRAAHIDAWGKALVQEQSKAWSKMFHTPVPESFFSKSIPCLSVDSIALAHEFHHLGASTVGYEVDSTNAHVPMRIAFERGAARQFNGSWLLYASSNFGDSCNTFAQQPIGQRGAGAWFHSRYAITDGVSASWYRKLYYMNYMAGASAVFWEQGLSNQFIKPGPGTHPIQLSPFGRATQDFQEFTARVPDPGVPYTPIAFLLSRAHAYDPVSYACKMLHVWDENASDRELRELFNVAWFPFPITQGLPQSPDAQSTPAGRYGDIFDVLVDRPEKSQAIMGYPVVWTAGDVDLAPLLPALKSYVQQGGTLVLNASALADPALQNLAGISLENSTQQSDSWSPPNSSALKSTPFLVQKSTLAGAQSIATANGLPLITRRQLGQGAVITSLIPHNTGLDERAHPALPWLMDAVTQNLIPIQVVTPEGARPTGQASYTFNKTPTGFIVTLYNPHGVDKTTNGIARVDRTQSTTLLLRSRTPISAATDLSNPNPKSASIPITQSQGFHQLSITIPASDLRVISLTTP